MSRGDGNIDGSNSRGENVRTAKSFDRAGRDGSPGAEIQAFWGYVNVGPSVEDKRALVDIHRGGVTGDIGRGRGWNVGLKEIDRVRV